MDEIVKYECIKYTTQLFEWLKIRYPNNLYDYLVLEDENLITIKIIMNVSIKFYEKKGIGNSEIHTKDFPISTIYNYKLEI